MCVCVCEGLRTCVCLCPIILDAFTKWKQKNNYYYEFRSGMEHYNQNRNTLTSDKEAKATLHMQDNGGCTVLTPPSLHLSGPSEESHFALSARPLHAGDASWPY